MKPEQASKVKMRKPTRQRYGEGSTDGEAIDARTRSLRRGNGNGTLEKVMQVTGETRCGEDSGLNVASGGGRNGGRTGS